MVQPLPGSVLQDEDWDSSLPIQPFHTNGGDDVVPQTPARSSASQEAKAHKQRYFHKDATLPSPETLPRARDFSQKRSGSASNGLLAQTQLPTQPGTQEKVQISPTTISSPSQVTPPQPPPQTHRGGSALPTPQSNYRTNGNAYSRPPETPTKPKRSSREKSGCLTDTMELRKSAAQVYTKDLSKLEKPVKRSHTESRALLGPPSTTVTRRPTEGNVQSVDEDAAPLIFSCTPLTSATTDKRLASAMVPAQSHLDDMFAPSKVINKPSTSIRLPSTDIIKDEHLTGGVAVQLHVDDVVRLPEVINNQLTSNRPASTKVIKDKRPGLDTTPAQPHVDEAVHLSKIINKRSIQTRPIGHCPVYADPNWTNNTPDVDGPPMFFHKLPATIPLLALWPAGGVGIFSNGKRLEYFQACDVGVLMRRERGEKVCDTNTVNNVGHILQYEMGLGKTVTTIALIVSNPASPTFEGSTLNPASPTFKGSHATLVVTPNKGIMDHWRSQITKFTPQLRVCYYDFISTKLNDIEDVVVCTYTQVRKQYGAVREGPKNKEMWPLFQRTWFRVVLDEAHVIRNPETQAARAIWALRKWHGLCLTGTPAQNSHHDLYSLFRFLGVTYNDLETFRKVYPKRSKGIVHDSRILDVLKRDFRVTRNSVITLPKRTDTTIGVKFTCQERQVYSSVETWKIPEMVKIIRLRQVCDHPFLIGGKQGSFHGDTSSKIEAVMRILNERKPGQKTVVFTRFAEVIPFITSALRRENARRRESALRGESALRRLELGFTTYDGTMSPEKRRNALKEISEGDSCDVIIASIEAGGVGIELTACNTVILLEPWWNPFAEEQAISRSYRSGQKLPVDVFRLVVEDSIEESIKKTQMDKREMMKDISGPCPPLERSTCKAWLAGP